MAYRRPAIVLIDDDPDTQYRLSPILKAAGFAPVCAPTGREGLQLVTARSPALVFLDLKLPDQDGKDVILRLRANSKVPLIVLTSRNEESEKILAFDFGADDYVVKPFSVGELLARVRAALRRWPAENANPDLPPLMIGPLTLDLSSRTAKLDSRILELTALEWEVLHVLAKNAGRVLTYAEICNGVGRSCDPKALRTLRVIVSRLRKAVGNSLLLENRHHIGYSLSDTGQSATEASRGQNPNVLRNFAHFTSLRDQTRIQQAGSEPLPMRRTSIPPRGHG